jgi:hypothetical protein
MTNGATGKQDKKKDELLDKIRNALTELVQLKIVTAVGPITAAVDPNDRSRIVPEVTSVQDSSLMYTRINLLDGDIVTCIPDKFVTGDYKDLREFHAAREKQAHEMIKGNFAALKELLALVRSLPEG